MSTEEIGKRLVTLLKQMQDKDALPGPISTPHPGSTEIFEQEVTTFFTEAAQAAGLLTYAKGSPMGSATARVRLHEAKKALLWASTQTGQWRGHTTWSGFVARFKEILEDLG